MKKRVSVLIVVIFVALFSSACSLPVDSNVSGYVCNKFQGEWVWSHPYFVLTEGPKCSGEIQRVRVHEEIYESLKIGDYYKFVADDDK